MDLRFERLKFITAVVLYGTIGMFLRAVNLPSEVVAMARGCIGSIFILLFMKMRHIPLNTRSIRRNLYLLLISGILLGLNWVFLFAAYIKTTVAIAILCTYMAPLIVILVAPAVLHEKMNLKKLPCVGVAFVGIVLVSGVIGGGGGANLPGVLLGLAAAACFVGIVLCNRKMEAISPYDKSLMQLALSAVTVLPYVLVRNGWSWVHTDLRSAMIVIMLGIVHTGFAYCLYFSGMGTLPVQTVAVLGYLEPVVSVLCSALILHERMSILGWVGAVMIIGAAVVSEIIE